MSSYKERAIAYLRTRAMRDPFHSELIGEIADDLDQMTEELVVRQKAVEPFFKNGVVGREVVRCGYCGQEEIGKGRFCKMCGKRLVDTLDVEDEP